MPHTTNNSKAHPRESFFLDLRKLSVGSSTHRNLKASRSVSSTPIVKNAFSMLAINATL